MGRGVHVGHHCSFGDPDLGAIDRSGEALAGRSHQGGVEGTGHLEGGHLLGPESASCLTSGFDGVRSPGHYHLSGCVVIGHPHAVACFVAGHFHLFVLQAKYSSHRPRGLFYGGTHGGTPLGHKGDRVCEVEGP